MQISPVTVPHSPTLKESRDMADGLEQAFLSEMLKYAGPRESSGEFSGGIGESQFSSFLNDAYAQAISERIDLKLIKRDGGKHD